MIEEGFDERQLVEAVGRRIRILEEYSDEKRYRVEGSHRRPELGPRRARELRRRVQRAVRAHVVVVLSPGLDDFARVRQADEPVLVRALVRETCR